MINLLPDGIFFCFLFLVIIFFAIFANEMNGSHNISQYEIFRQLRLPMIVLVTFAHSYGGVDEGFSLLTSEWNTYEFLRLLISQTLVKVAMPVFFIMSGYLFFRTNQGDRSRDSLDMSDHGPVPLIQDSRICYEGIVLDLNAKTVTLDGEELICTKLEFELLSFFLQHPGRVYSREDLLKYCWPQDVLVLDRTVDVNITRLRKKIGRYGQQIKTRVGYGYYFAE